MSSCALIRDKAAIANKVSEVASGCWFCPKECDLIYKFWKP